MDRKNLSPAEEKVNQILSGAIEKINAYEHRLNNLAPDKGPQLMPPGGPVPKSRAHQRVALEKEIVQAKEDTLQQIDYELKDAPADVRERCDYAVDNWLYPESIEPGQEKDLETSQAFIAKGMYEKKIKEQQPETLRREDRKTMEQSERFMFMERYGKEMPEPELSSADKESKEDVDSPDADKSPQPDKEIDKDDDFDWEPPPDNSIADFWGTYMYEEERLDFERREEEYLLQEGKREKEQQLEKTDKKTSYGFSFQQRYEKDLSSDKQPSSPDGKDAEVTKSDRKDLDASQDFAFSWRYREKPEPSRDLDAGESRTRDMHKDDINMDKD